MKKFILILFYILSFVLVCGTLLSMLDNTSSWYLKALDFPRLQFALAMYVLVCLALIFIRKWNVTKTITVIALLIGLGIQYSYIKNYTTFVSTEVEEIAASEAKPNSIFSTLILNVYMKNKAFDKTIQLIEKKMPDVVLLMETDEAWDKALSPIYEAYPYVEKKILPNTYGIILLSKFPLSNVRILDLSNPDVPSIHAELKLPSDDVINFHGMHPVPPVPSEHPDNVGEKENELLIVGRMAKEKGGMHLVCGDLNDVSWSKNLRLFGQDKFLKNVNFGRGIFNTYKSSSMFKRWPLDHYYVTDEIKLIQIEKLPSVDSDHFPIYAKFGLMN